MGKRSKGGTLASAGMSPHVFACIPTTDKVPAVKSTMALMLAHSLLASSFNSPHPGHEKTHCCTSSQPQGCRDHVFDPGKDTSPATQHKVATLLYVCPSPSPHCSPGSGAQGWLSPCGIPSPRSIFHPWGTPAPSGGSGTGCLVRATAAVSGFSL